MKRLDKFIDEHRQQMDIYEPSEGHMLRFQKKLYVRKPLSIKWIAGIAASFLFMSLIGLNLLNLRSKPQVLSEDLKEAEWFYNSKSEQLIAEIQASNKMEEADKSVVFNDLKNFDKEYVNIMSDLKEFPEDERIINAFLEYHRSRTEFLEEILNQVNSTII